MFEVQKDILRELQHTLAAVQRPRQLPAPALDLEEQGHQTKLLQEISFFCQKLTTQKKSNALHHQPSQDLKQFTCSTPLIQQEEPDPPKDEPPKEEPLTTKPARFPFEFTTPPSAQTVKKQQLLIKQLRFVQEEPTSWIPPRVERRLARTALNLCIFWPIEQLASLQFQSYNILSCIESLKSLEFFQKSIKVDIPFEQWQFGLLNSQFLQQLKPYTIMICRDDLAASRELYVRLHTIKQELRSDAIYERKRNMLDLEQMRIIKRIVLKHLRLQCKYRSIVLKHITEVNQIRNYLLLKLIFKSLYQQSRKIKEQREFNSLVEEHMTAFKKHQTLNRMLQLSRQCRAQRKTAALALVIKRSVFRSFVIRCRELGENNDQLSSQFLSDEKQKPNQVSDQKPKVQSNEKSNSGPSGNRSTQNPKQGKQQNHPIQSPTSQNKNQSLRKVDLDTYKPQCDEELPTTLLQNEFDFRKSRLIRFELGEQLFQTSNLKRKVLIKWKVAYLQRYEEHLLAEIMRQKQQRRLFNCLKSSIELSPNYDQIYKTKLVRRSFKALKAIWLEKKNYQSLQRQRQQIDSMAMQVFESNMLKKVFAEWKRLKLKKQLRSLSRKKNEERERIAEIRVQMMEAQKKRRVFQRWRKISKLSKRSIRNLEECERRTRERVIADLIRVAFESSLQTQFGWLQYYDD